MSRSASRSGSRSSSRISTNRDRVRCYKCREFDHFASDCPTPLLMKIQTEMIQVIQPSNVN